METFFSVSKSDSIFLFKSYYVVWKLLYAYREFPIFLPFKSYYVVWKRTSEKMKKVQDICLNRTMQYGNPRWVVGAERRSGFKSYYVVWKPFRLSSLFAPRNCLNRTMQYGNPQDFSQQIAQVLCLNRTMQYGNSNR